MSQLQYKTRGMSSPQGKQKVFFCCHPADFESCFPAISDEILQYQNCSIWYEDTESAPFDTQMRDNLREMQLFVMPVTTKLLITPNRALEQEFPFAIENHIPVLPLMQEGGLEELFNLKCGDIQFLDKNAHDPSAISYEQKLDKYLSSVLIGDELAEQVRAAFDAYIFLSYRKKDRQYAQELMRLIHENDFCRNIAIWYDEYLTPGENFNDAIAKALQKSELFTLVVTPNLVNEPNYVMEHEYPAARDSGKPILPAEVVPTDQEQLKEKYNGLPPCVDVGNERELSTWLLEQVQRLAFQKIEDDPQHNFFIGLAYLNGIDVEVNHERAVNLITSAAEAGLPEAMKRLVDMYRSGTGAERNYQSAITWQEMLAEFRKTDFYRNCSKNAGKALLHSLWDLGDFYYELRKFTLAKKAFKEMQELCKTVQQCELWDALQELSISNIKLAEISGAEGNVTEAKEYCLCGTELSRQIVEKTKTIGDWRLLSVNYGTLGDICKAEGQIDEAQKYYLCSLELSHQIAEETDDILIRQDLSATYNSLGDISSSMGRLTEAQKYYLCSLELNRRIAEEARIVQGISDSYEKLSNASMDMGHLEEAKDYCLRGLEIRCRLAEETATVTARRNLAVSYGILADINMSMRHFVEARHYYLQSLKLFQQLVEETGTRVAQRDLAVNFIKLGDISLVDGNVVKAKEYYFQSLGLFRKLADETGMLEAQLDLSLTFSKLGKISKTEGRLTEAKDYYQQALNLSNQVVEETKVILARQYLAADYNALGEISEAEGQLAKAKEYYLQGMELCRQIKEELGTVAARQTLSVSYEKLGNISKTEGDLDEARQYYQQELELNSQIAKETGTAETRRSLSVSYVKMGEISEAERQLSKAKEYYQQALELFNYLAQETKEVLAQRDLAVCCNKLGNIYKVMGQLLEAKECYLHSVELSCQMLKTAETVDNYDNLAISLYNLGTVDEKEVDQEVLTRALVIWDGLAKQYPSISRFAKRRDIVAKRLLEHR